MYPRSVAVAAGAAVSRYHCLAFALRRSFATLITKFGLARGYFYSRVSRSLAQRIAKSTYTTRGGNALSINEEQERHTGRCS